MYIIIIIIIIIKICSVCYPSVEAVYFRNTGYNLQGYMVS